MVFNLIVTNLSSKLLIRAIFDSSTHTISTPMVLLETPMDDLGGGVGYY